MVKQTEGLAYASGISVHQAEEYNMTTGANPATFTNFETSLITPVASTVSTTVMGIIEGTGLKPHNSIGAHKSAALLRLVLHSHRRQRPMDPASRLCIVLLLEMVTAANPASTRATVLLEQAHGIEVDAVSGLFRPRDREWMAKERSSHWSNMLLSSRVYFDSSMKDIFRMDSSRIVALFKAVCPGMVPKNRDAPDAIVPPKRLAISSMCVRTVQHHE
ncbi:hypothetical protein PC117_g5428 [Phytophthora cactorum]|uniref:Uncharacterized protein n=1 Tax=Phytophthora cactorum TaxID=29920 RepID=A0A8T1E4I3_9STRA|nr:hypothetical protein PC117_g5428 [Phytophthora cactorum]